jgi:beta-glucosidase
MILLKNSDKTLPLKKQLKVYIPKRFTPAGRNFFGMETPSSLEHPISLDVVNKYFSVTQNPAEADFAMVCIANPNSGSGYDPEDVKKGGNGYVPISLQYRPYRAVDAREISIAGGDPLESFTNRSYKNKTVTAVNTTDLNMVLDARKAMGSKPVIVVIDVSKPMVFSEFEREVPAILLTFGIQDQAIMDILTGAYEPSGLLPFQMPADMKTVELQKEDVPFDMTCHTDADGNTYDFGFGLNWSGVIKDARVEKYGK